MKDPTAILTAAFMALRSYQYGNASDTLAKDTADAIEKFVLDRRGAQHRGHDREGWRQHRRGQSGQAA